MNLLEERINEFTQDKGERETLNLRFRTVEDFARAVKNGLTVWKLEDYKANLKENGFHEEEIEETIKRADIIDGYVIEIAL